MPCQIATFSRVELLAPLVLFLLSLTGCTRNYSIQVIPGGPSSPDLFPQIKNRAQRSTAGSEGGITLTVFYAPGEEDLVASALEEVKKPARFLSDATGVSPRGAATFYLHPLPADGIVPYYTVHGPGIYTGVFFYRTGGPLSSVLHNREWLTLSYPHELAHHYLDAVLRLDDRWLGDGLPEYLASEFAWRNDPELARGDHRGSPPVIALSRAELLPWDMSDFAAFRKRLAADPAYAQLLGERGVWKYAAAEELVRRWRAAAKERGIQDPLRDLLDRARSLGRPVDWNATRELARAQTGRSLEELGRVTPEELAAAQARAWEERADPNLGARVFALRVLAELGLPPGKAAADLLPAFAIPPEFAEVRQGWVWEVGHAGGEALAKANEPAAAMQTVALFRERYGADGYQFIPPELWRVIAASDRQLALAQLAAILTQTDASLSLQERANAALKDLTGQDVGWSIDASPEERQASAMRWQAVLSSVVGK